MPWSAERDGKTVGRISAILQRASNEKHGETRVRFTRFDSIDDPEVAKALFDAVENFARARGMNAVSISLRVHIAISLSPRIIPQP